MVYSYKHETRIDIAIRDLELILKCFDKTDKETVYVFGGCHGYPNGENWNESESHEQGFLMDELIDDVTFFSYLIERLSKKYKRNVEFIDAKHFRSYAFIDLLREKKGHIMLIFCHSYFDKVFKALRHFIEEPLQQLDCVQPEGSTSRNKGFRYLLPYVRNASF